MASGLGLAKSGPALPGGPGSEHTGVQRRIVTRTPVEHALRCQGAGAPAVLHHVAESGRCRIDVALDRAGRNADDVGITFTRRCCSGGGQMLDLSSPRQFVFTRTARSAVVRVASAGRPMLSGQRRTSGGPWAVATEVLVHHAQIGAGVVPARAPASTPLVSNTASYSALALGCGS